MPLRIRVDDYRGLTRCDWTLEPGVSLLVGPNGSGKTTLLEVPLLLRHAIEVGTRSAVDRHGGPGQLVNLRAKNVDKARIEAAAGDLCWALELMPHGAELGVSHRITAGDKQVVEKREPYFFVGVAGGLDAPPDRIALEAANEAASPEMKVVCEQMPSVVQKLVAPLRGYELFGGYWVRSLRLNGSNASSHLALDQDGGNAFSVLRNWRDARATRPRWEFVASGLKAAFPDVFEELEFESAGQTVAARIFSPRMRQSIGAYFAPDGLLTGLLHLAAVASVPDGGALAIDEFETTLHPYAIRSLLDHIRAWSADRAVSVTLASHSPVLIDQSRQEPSMTRIALIVTGELERLGLAQSLRRAFPVAEIVVDMKVESFTSARVRGLETEAPGRLVDKVAAALVAAVEPGRRGRAADFAVAVEDLELRNLDQPEIVVGEFRKAILRHVDRHWPSELRRERARRVLSERASFHLLVPMLEVLLRRSGSSCCRGGQGGTTARS